MARQELFVDSLKLKQVIDLLEDEQIAKGSPAHRPFRSRHELHKAIAATDWGQAIGLTPAVAALRIERFGIECKTGVRGRVMTVATGAAPAEASVASVASVAPGAEPDEMATPVRSPVQRRSVFRGIDLDAFLSPFLERGLEIDSLSSIMTSSLHTKNENLKIQAAWHDLRERFNIPRVGDKPQEIESILPLDQVRLPGDEVGESVDVLESVPASTEFDSEVVEEGIDTSEDLVTDDELIADEFPELYKPAEEYDPNTDNVGAVGAGWPEGDYDEAQPADGEFFDSPTDEFYDPATDEATIEQVQDSVTIEDTQDTVEQESGVTLDQEPYLGPLPEEGASWTDEFEALVNETPSESDQGENQEDYLATGEFPLDEPQEVYPEQGDPQDENPTDYPTGPFPEPGLYQNAWPNWEASDKSQDSEVEESPEDEIPLDAYPAVTPEQGDLQEVDLELDEFLAAGETPPSDSQEAPSESGSFQAEYSPYEGHEQYAQLSESVQDEYLPLDFEGVPESVEELDADNYDNSMYETEETDPNETR